MNIADAFAEHARTRPDHPAVEDGDRVVTYGELEALANTAAANLLSEGIEQGDIVGIALADSVEQVALIWARARVGATMFMLDAELLRSGQETRLSGCRLKAVVVEEAVPDLPSETKAIPLAAVFRNNPKTPPLAVLDGPGDQHPLFRVQSSGTTGTPAACSSSASARFSRSSVHSLIVRSSSCRALRRSACVANSGRDSRFSRWVAVASARHSSSDPQAMAIHWSSPAQR